MRVVLLPMTPPLKSDCRHGTHVGLGLRLGNMPEHMANAHPKNSRKTNLFGQNEEFLISLRANILVTYP